MAILPNSNQVGRRAMSEEYGLYASLHTTRSRRGVARLFRPPTWKVRKCGWTDYEITSTFAELVIEAKSPILMNGSVTDFEANAERILAPLRLAGVAYKAECYRADGQLLREFAWGSPNLSQRRPRAAAAVYRMFKAILGSPDS